MPNLERAAAAQDFAELERLALQVSTRTNLKQGELNQLELVLQMGKIYPKQFATSVKSCEFSVGLFSVVSKPFFSSESACLKRLSSSTIVAHFSIVPKPTS